MRSELITLVMRTLFKQNSLQNLSKDIIITKAYTRPQRPLWTPLRVLTLSWLFFFSSFFLFFLGSSSLQASLDSQAPNNLFALIEKAPLVLQGEIESVQSPQEGQTYFLYEIEVKEVFSHNLPEAAPKKGKKISVLQEQLFPEDLPQLKEGQGGVFFLAALPKYTAYQKAVQQGVSYSLYGGENQAREALVVQDFPQRVKEVIAAKSGERVPELKRKALLLSWLQSGEPMLWESAALALQDMNFSKGALSDEEAKQISAVLMQLKEDSRLSRKTGLPLVDVLAQTQSVTALQTVANQTQGEVKWAAVRALEKLGYPRSTQELTQDFAKANDQNKERILKILIRKQDEESRSFLTEFLQSPERYELKRNAIFEMGSLGGEPQEKFLISQLNQLEPSVAAQAAIVLGQMNSAASVPEMFKLLQSDEKILREAAQASLRFNQTPLAREYVKANFTKDSHGHVHPKRHFFDIPGPSPSSHDLDHNSSHVH